MNFKDIAGICLRNLFRRRTRTILAIIGVVIGTSAIVVMLSVGFGLSENNRKQVESYGNLHLINVMTFGGGEMIGGSGGGEGPGKKRKTQIDDKGLAAMEKIPGVTAVTPVVTEYLTIIIGKKTTQTEVVGVRSEVLEKFNYKVEKGRMLQPSDKYGILFGNQVPTWFSDPKQQGAYGYGSEEGINVVVDKVIISGDLEYGTGRPSGQSSEPDSENGGQKTVFKEHAAKGVGLLQNPDDESSYVAFMNLKDLQEIQKEVRKARKERVLPQSKNTYSQAMMYVEDINQVGDISKYLREEGYQTHSDNDFLEAMKKTTRMIQGILGGIGCISLLVAALGITNTMIMSIYERTKEIGIMKVIGANLRDIRRMFLMEAGMIGFLGGVTGVLFSFLISFLMNTFLSGIISGALFDSGVEGSKISIIPIWTALAAISFATLIGLMAGYYPAKRAMRLSALESLRNE